MSKALTRRASAIPGTCSVGDCEEPTHSGGTMCMFHSQRRTRGQDLSAPKQEQFVGLRERVSHLCDRLANANAEGDDTRKAAWDALRHALVDWSRHLMRSRGGKATKKALSAKQRSTNARKAARARWRSPS